MCDDNVRTLVRWCSTSLHLRSPCHAFTCCVFTTLDLCVLLPVVANATSSGCSCVIRLQLQLLVALLGLAWRLRISGSAAGVFSLPLQLLFADSSLLRAFACRGECDFVRLFVRDSAAAAAARRAVRLFVAPQALRKCCWIHLAAATAALCDSSPVRAFACRGECDCVQLFVCGVAAAAAARRVSPNPNSMHSLNMYKSERLRSLLDVSRSPGHGSLPLLAGRADGRTNSCVRGLAFGRVQDTALVCLSVCASVSVCL